MRSMFERAFEKFGIMSIYSFRKDEIIHVLEIMLHSAAFEFDNHSAVDQDLQQYKQGKADFSNYLIGAVSR